VCVCVCVCVCGLLLCALAFKLLHRRHTRLDEANEQTTQNV